MLRLVFYFKNFDTLGHATQVYSLIRGLKACFKDKIRILIVESGERESAGFPFRSYAEYFFLPLLPQNIFISDNEVKSFYKKRYLRLKEALLSFKPDILFTEYYPFRNGLEYNGFPLLFEILKKKFKTRMISSCTYLTCDDSTDELIKSYYQIVLFHLPESLSSGYKTYLPDKSKSQVERILNTSGNRVVFTGFTLDANQGRFISTEVMRKKLEIGRKKLVVVSRGGRKDNLGIVLTALALVQKRKDCFFLIMAGESLEEIKNNPVLAKFVNASKNLRIASILHSGFDNYLRAADLSINMAGYATMIKLLFLKKRSIVIANDNTEQRWHASIIKECLVSRSILYKDLTTGILGEKIEELFSQRRSLHKDIPESWFLGVKNTVRLVKEIS